MTDDRGVVEQALDIFVYAPLGLALEAKDLLPKLAERGRGQVALARVAGRFAAQRGQDEARRVAGDRRRPDSGTGSAAPFDDYDELTAVQVIARLGELDEHDLEALDAYEEEHRQRSTILNRVRQLRA